MKRKQKTRKEANNRHLGRWQLSQQSPQSISHTPMHTATDKGLLTLPAMYTLVSL